MSPHSVFPLKTTHLNLNTPLHSKNTVILCLVILLIASISPSYSKERIPYKEHCDSIVSEPIPTGLASDSHFPDLSGYVTKGDAQFLGPEKSTNTESYLTFKLYSVHSLDTKSDGVLQINARLYIRSPRTEFDTVFMTNRSSRVRKRHYVHRTSVSFDLSGFWSASTGRLCMVGNGWMLKNQNDMEVSGILKLNYANISDISTSLTTGTIESSDSDNSPSHFDSLKVVAYALRTSDNYNYTLTKDVEASCSRPEISEESLAITSTSPCSYLESYFLNYILRLQQLINCSSCGPFATSRFISFNTMQCSEDDKVHLLIKFSNNSRYLYHQEFMPGMSLIGEGFWDKKKNRLCLLACQVLVDKANGDASVGDCSIALTLWFPSVLTLENMKTVVGRIWSNKNEKDDGYFRAVSFSNYGEYSDVLLQGLKYKYTESDNVMKYCKTTEVPKIGKKKFPLATSRSDLNIDFMFPNSGINMSWGRAKLMSVDDEFVGGNSHYVTSWTDSSQAPNYSNDRISSFVEVPTPAADDEKNAWNVSYKIQYYSGNASEELYVEGIYSSSTGNLCMTGCRQIGENQTDCKVVVNFQLASLNPEYREQHTGTISSRRSRGDPLYFVQKKVSGYGMYREQASQSVERMDIEIVMVIVSLTFSCFCIAVQLFHVKKHPDVLLYVSIFMLVILTLGHMIPLLLNFEALFSKTQNRPNVLLSTGGWATTNEVIVRVLTMVAFLLHFRLLQQTWSAKLKEESNKSLWIAEKETLMLCFPLYLAGGFLAWFIFLKPSSNQLAKAAFGGNEQIHTLWKDLIAYSGLVLDGFLLPQIVLNIFSDFNSDKVPLKSVFYVGTTVVRAAPHLYDAYRARHYVPFLNSSYIYASRDNDFYSLAWDVIIPCGGVLFALLVFLQQRYGGTHILPAKLRKLGGGYQQVPVISS